MQWQEFTNTESQIQDLTLGFDWPHSIIREINFISPSYYQDKWEIAPDALPSARVFISSASEETPGLELLFVEIDHFEINFRTELEASISLSTSSFSDYPIEFNFTESPCRTITSKRLFYRHLHIDTHGYKLLYSQENIYDESGELITPI